MATFSKRHFEYSSGGRSIAVAATSSPGTQIHHTADSSLTIDEIWLYATNTSTSAVTLTVEHGGTTNPSDRIILSIPPQSGLTLVLPGLVLTGTGGDTRQVRAFASSANVINIHGYVNRVG